MKTGKTTFCCQADHALILATEIGTNAQPGAFVQPIRKYADFKLVLKQLENPEVKEKFHTICIDTIPILYDLCEQYVCAQNGVSKIGDIPFGSGYAQLSKEFEADLRKITMLSYGLVFVSHLKETYDEEGKLISAKPDMNNRCLKIVNALVDISCVITQTWNNKGESERWIQTRSTPTITAGSRFPYLPEKIPFSFQSLENAIIEAIDKQEAEGATVVDYKDVQETEILDYNALMEEARQIWDKLVHPMAEEGGDEQMALTILKKIEMVFGRKIKISEIMEDQVDLLNLVLIELRELNK